MPRSRMLPSVIGGPAGIWAWRFVSAIPGTIKAATPLPSAGWAIGCRWMAG